MRGYCPAYLIRETEGGIGSAGTQESCSWCLTYLYNLSPSTGLLRERKREIEVERDEDGEREQRREIRRRRKKKRKKKRKRRGKEREGEIWKMH